MTIIYNTVDLYIGLALRIKQFVGISYFAVACSFYVRHRNFMHLINHDDLIIKQVFPVLGSS